MVYLCDYGCGQEAKYQFKNGKWCCSKNISQCSVIRKKMSDNHADVRGKNNPRFEKQLTKETRKKMSLSATGIHRTPFEEIIEFTENQGCEMLSKEEDYKDQFSKLWFRCPKGHIFKMRWDTFKSGCRCQECANFRKRNRRQSKETIEKRVNQTRTSFESIVKIAKIRGIILLTTEEEYKRDYKNQFSKLWFMCVKGHVFQKRWDNFKAGSDCTECSNTKKSEDMSGENHPMWKKHHKEESKKKQRLWRIKDIESKHGQVSPNYNPEACKLIDKYGKENNFNFQHAENGGEYHIKELGYWADGYDKEKNIVIEIDEKAHFDKDGNLKKKDIQRQKEITDFLGCKFIRLKI